MHNPLVTVLLPVFNAAPYVSAAIASIQAQDYPSLDILVIDDGSTDGSTDILGRLADRDKRIRLFVRENQGLVATLNQGLDLARGAYIARMDADDIAYPHRISMQVKALSAAPHACFAGTAADYLFGKNRVLRKIAEPRSNRDLAVELICDPFFIHPTVMFNRNILDRDGYRYNPTFVGCEDFDLWRRIAKRSELVFIPRQSLAWRQGHDSIRSRERKKQNPLGLRIVDEELAANGIALGLPDLVDVFMCCHSGHIGDRAKEFGSKLTAIHSFGGFTGQDRLSYLRGMRAMINALLYGAASYDAFNNVLRVIAQAKINNVVPTRYKLTNMARHCAADRVARHALELLQSVSRRARSVDLRKLVPLSPTILEVLDPSAR